MQTPTPKLPEDVMESIFSYVQPHEVLHGPTLSDARRMIALSDIPAATKTIEKVIELDTIAPIPGVQACSASLLSPSEVIYIVSKAKNLRKIRVTHVLGSCFLPLLKDVEDVEFIDAEDVDITHIAPRVHFLKVHSPTETTLKILTEIGRSLKDVAFTAVKWTLIAKVIKVLDKWKDRISSISVFIKEPFPNCRPTSSDRALKELLSYLSMKGPAHFTSLKVVKIGRFDDINCEFDVDLRRKLKDCSEFWDAEFLCFRPPLSRFDMSVVQIPRKITAFGLQEQPFLQTAPENYSKLQELSLLGKWHPGNRSSHNSYKLMVTAVAQTMKSLTHLSIRLRVVMKEAAIDCDVFNFIRFFLDARKEVDLLEVTKDFILLPMMCKDMAKLLFCKMTNVRTLVLTNRPREVLLCCPVLVEHTRNKTVAKALPLFLAFVKEHCATMECVFLSDCGEIEVTKLSEPEVGRNLILAMKAIETFEKENTRVDISTVKAQIGTWARCLKVETDPHIAFKSSFQTLEYQ